MVRRVVSLLCVLALVTLGASALSAPSARADGDPASDALLGLNVFYPYDPAVSHALQLRLNRLANQAHAAKLPIKIALIGRPTDLGVVPSLFDKPRRYAEYLEREISFQGPQPLLVVMPSGYGLEGFRRAVVAAAGGLPRPGAGAGSSSSSSDALAQAALRAIPVLAKADGHPLSSPRKTVSTSNGSGSDSTLLLIILILAAIIVATLLLLLRLRQAIRTG